MKQIVVGLANALMASGLASDARADEHAKLPRVQSTPTIDGRLDEAMWAAITPVSMIVYEPVWGATPKQRSEIRIAHDGHNLLVGAKLYDDQPDSVRVGSFYRDRYGGDDTVGIIVDGFNDGRNALWFYTTPAGMRADGAVIDDMQAGDGDFNWNGHWSAAAVRTDFGWSAEMKIPFSTLGFSSDAGSAVMGLSVYRWLAREGERQVWPAVQPLWARAYAKPSKLRDVRLEGVQSVLPFYFTPYFLLGVSDDNTVRASGDSGLDWTAQAGGDLRLALLPSLTLDVTVNTDFAQAEADDQQINLTRFPLFFPEKRQFFLERADIFAFAWERDNRLFHSRRVGLRQGQPVRIYGGTRLAGRIGAWDLGVLDMKTAAPDSPGFGENLSVLRVRRRLPDSGSSVGVMVTSRLSAGGGDNLVAASDVDLRIIGDEFLTAKAAWSTASGIPPETPTDELDPEQLATEARRRTGTRWLLSWQRRALRGLAYELTAASLSEGYRSDLGFEDRSDVSFGHARAAYQWLSLPGFLSSVWIDGEASAYLRESRDLDSLRLYSSANAETPIGHAASLWVMHQREEVSEPFQVADLAIAEGSYSLNEVGLTLGAADWLVLRPELTLVGGTFYGGHRLGGSATLTLNPGGHFDLAADYELNALRIGSGERTTTQLLRLRMELALDIHASLSTFAQYNSADGIGSLNARARYHFEEGTDLWLVYDEWRYFGSARGAASSATGVDATDVELPGRSLLLKLSLTWSP